MEGKLRAVVIVSTPHGFVMETHRVTVQDPISIDVSLPVYSSSDSSLANYAFVQMHTMAHWNDKRSRS